MYHDAQVVKSNACDLDIPLDYIQLVLNRISLVAKQRSVILYGLSAIETVLDFSIDSVCILLFDHFNQMVKRLNTHLIFSLGNATKCITKHLLFQEVCDNIH